MSFGAMAGSGLGMLSGACTLCSWANNRKLDKWEKVNAKNEADVRDYKKKSSVKGYRKQQQKATRKIANAERRKGTFGKIGAGLGGLQMVLGVVTLVVQIYSIYKAEKERREELEKNRDKL